MSRIRNWFTLASHRAGQQVFDAAARSIGYGLGRGVSSTTAGLFRPRIHNIHDTTPWRYIYDSHQRRSARERDYWRFPPIGYYSQARARDSYQRR